MHAWKGGKKMVANNTTPPPPWSSKKENTEPIWLFHSHQSLPQCSPIVPTAKNEVIDSQKQVWGDGLENEKKRNQSNRQKTHHGPSSDLFTQPQSQHESTLTPWVRPMINALICQSTKWDKDPPTFAHRMAVDDDEDGRKGENGPIFLIFFDGHPKPLPKNHYNHSLIHRIPNECSEKIKRKDGETMTKIEKRKGTTLTFGRPFPSDGFGHVSLWRFSQNQPKNNGYMRHFNTVVMSVLT